MPGMPRAFFFPERKIFRSSRAAKIFRREAGHEKPQD
jgi:hypothetical protein